MTVAARTDLGTLSSLRPGLGIVRAVDSLKKSDQSFSGFRNPGLFKFQQSQAPYSVSESTKGFSGTSRLGHRNFLMPFTFRCSISGFRLTYFFFAAV